MSNPDAKRLYRKAVTNAASVINQTRDNFYCAKLKNCEGDSKKLMLQSTNFSTKKKLAQLYHQHTLTLKMQTTSKISLKQRLTTFIMELKQNKEKLLNAVYLCPRLIHWLNYTVLIMYLMKSWLP